MISSQRVLFCLVFTIIVCTSFIQCELVALEHTGWEKMNLPAQVSTFPDEIIGGQCMRNHTIHAIYHMTNSIDEANAEFILVDININTMEYSGRSLILPGFANESIFQGVSMNENAECGIAYAVVSGFCHNVTDCQLTIHRLDLNEMKVLDSVEIAEPVVLYAGQITPIYDHYNQLLHVQLNNRTHIGICSLNVSEPDSMQLLNQYIRAGRPPGYMIPEVTPDNVFIHFPYTEYTNTYIRTYQITNSIKYKRLEDIKVFTTDEKMDGFPLLTCKITKSRKMICGRYYIYEFDLVPRILLNHTEKFKHPVSVSYIDPDDQFFLALDYSDNTIQFQLSTLRQIIQGKQQLDTCFYIVAQDTHSNYISCVNNTGITLFSSTVCPSGHKRVVHESIRMVYTELALVTCEACNAGEYAEYGNNTCTQCVPGTASAYNASGQCFTCLPGYFSNHKGATECTMCPSRTYSPSNGTVTCQPCYAASYSGSTKCPLSNAVFSGILVCAIGLGVVGITLVVLAVIIYLIKKKSVAPYSTLQ